jgi:uncharacterized protein (DUF2147 family)
LIVQARIEVAHEQEANMHAFVLIGALALQAPAPDQPIEGTWRSPGGNTIITIAPCGNGPCGTVAWATEKAKKDAAKTTAQLVGTQLLTNLQKRKDGSWLGKLFIPDRNMRVTAKLQRLSPDSLKVSGCAAGKALCKADIWTAFSASLPTDTSVPAPR